MRRAALSAADAVALALIAGWSGWVIASTLMAGRPVGAAVAALIPPLVGVAGVALGRWLRRRPEPWLVPAVLVGVGIVFFVGWFVADRPGRLPTTYANANAAIGVQLLAATTVAWLTRRQKAPGRADAVWHGVAAALAVGTIVTNNSIAGSATGILVALVCGWAVTRRFIPPRWLWGTLMGATVISAAVGLLWLATRPAWPALALRGLSWVRQQLWAHAVDVWAAHPVTGGGAGAFREANPFAVDPDLTAAHSSLLQVGADFGWVGVACFALLLGAGIVVALRAAGPAGMVAAAAWGALAVHALMDHLYEFWAVMLTAGGVLGLASALVGCSGSPGALALPGPALEESDAP